MEKKIFFSLAQVVPIAVPAVTCCMPAQVETFGQRSVVSLVEPLCPGGVLVRTLLRHEHRLVAGLFLRVSSGDFW